MPTTRSPPSSRQLKGRDSGVCQCLGGCQAAQAVVIPLLVVFEHPGPAHFPHLIKAAEQLGVQHIGSIAAVETLDECILVRLPRLDVIDHHVMLLTPVYEDRPEELRTVIRPQHIR